MKNNIEKLIPKAMKAVEIELVQNGKIASVYNGYISSLGAGLVQAGLLPTLAFYASLNARSKEKRTYLLQAIYRIIFGDKIGTDSKLKGDELLKEAIKVQGKPTEMYALKKQIRDAAVAIKLSLRTFELDKSVKEES